MRSKSQLLGPALILFGLVLMLLGVIAQFITNGTALDGCRNPVLFAATSDRVGVLGRFLPSQVRYIYRCKDGRVVSSTLLLGLDAQ